MAQKLNIKTVSSMEKLLTGYQIEELNQIKEVSLLGNEKTSFQIAYRMADEINDNLKIKISVESPIKEHIKIYRVIQMAVEMPVLDTCQDDDNILTVAGMLPDLLMPFSEGEVIFMCNHRLCSLWCEVNAEQIPSGSYPVTVVFYTEEFGELNRCTIDVNIIGHILPKQELIHTEWFYCDCLKTYYEAETFDERHWKIIEEFMRTATEHGINMILTPLFTYALDTAVGHERPTTQLVKVSVNDKEEYEFDFTLLERFVKTAQRAGFEYFEMSHLFTQWGAKATPKIIANTKDGEKRIFGWEVPSDDPGYRRFLEQLLPKLCEELKKLGIEDKAYFHISDEPKESSIAEYKKCYDLLQSFISPERIIDAMSNLSYIENGVLRKPVPSTGSVQEFIDAGIKNLWTYYCCTARKDLSNRFMAMPTYRTRVLGIQLYLNNIVGFLHWGYNFYFSRYSLRPINPFLQTDCDGFAESGDAFLVYPGPGGKPYESIRLKVMADAMQDVRELKMLESIKGREFTVKLIKEYLGEVSFTEYPRNSKVYIELRNEVIKLISQM